MNIKRVGELSTALVRGGCVAVLLAVWALGAVWSVTFGKLAWFGMALADFAADAIEAARGR